MFEKIIEVRWADLDANQHVTHTAYATFATHARVSWMENIGCSIVRLLELGFGAVLLKEQTEYYREIMLGEKAMVRVMYAGGSEDYSRWKFINEIHKENGKLAAKHTIYGAWINTNIRRITTPPQEFIDIMSKVTKMEDFEVIAV